MEIIQATGKRTRLTITPKRVTLKLANELSDHHVTQMKAFAEYVVEQFVIVDREWRGTFDFEYEGCNVLATVMHSGNAHRRYEVVA